MRRWLRSSRVTEDEGPLYASRAADFEEIYEYLEKRRPAAAQSVKTTIERQIGWLASFPYIAPATDEDGVRELTLARHPYKIYYDVAGEDVRTFGTRGGGRGEVTVNLTDYHWLATASSW